MVSGADGTPKESSVATDLQSVVFFDVRGDKVLNALGYDKKGKIETLSAFYYWEDDTTTARREDKNIRKIKQYAWKDLSATVDAEKDLNQYYGTETVLGSGKWKAKPTAGDMVTGAEGTPKESTVATDLQSVVFFDVRGEKVLNALGYDKKGKLETLSAFFYWTDDAATARKEDKNIRKIKQWAAREGDIDENYLENYFGATLPVTAHAGQMEPPTDGVEKKETIADRLQSVVFFDVRGEKVLNALGYDKKGKLETLSAFFYWTDDAATARKEDKNIRKIKQWAAREGDIDEPYLENTWFGLAPNIANAGTIEPPTDGLEKKETIADRLQSVVFFDVRGEKVLNALGYDKKGKFETLSAFFYWTDDAATARKEDKNIRKIKQWAAREGDIDEPYLENTWFGLAPNIANAGTIEPPTDGVEKKETIADRLQSVVFFDVRGEKVLNALGYDKKGKLETLSAFFYWTDDAGRRVRKTRILGRS